ncbi:hypothetical protein N431DRAFT_562003 [Stipitochalara longipes BDJ]|nr:hypothetical protein N431DRAFT_562003 [Stipitochalara longipes BDJ]
MSEAHNARSGSGAGSNGSQEKPAKKAQPRPADDPQDNITVSSTSLASLESALRDVASELRKRNPPATKESKDSDVFYKNIGTVAALGASITFALIVSDIADPHAVSRHGRFDLSTVRILLAVAWMLFMVVLSLSFSIGQKVKHDSSEKGLYKWEKKRRERKNKILSTGVYVLELAAVTCLSLVVAAYVEVVGYIMVALVFLVVVALVLRFLGDRYYYIFASSFGARNDMDI